MKKEEINHSIDARSLRALRIHTTKSEKSANKKTKMKMIHGKYINIYSFQKKTQTTSILSFLLNNYVFKSHFVGRVPAALRAGEYQNIAEFNRHRIVVHEPELGY